MPKKIRELKYTIVIQWSNEDKCYVVSLPDFTDIMKPCTHGDTYEEALKNAKSDIDLAHAQSELVVMIAQLTALRKYRQKR